MRPRLVPMIARLDDMMWVFAHGSLMFSPGFEAARTLVATADGWERRFGQPSIRNWGTPDHPAPTCSLTRGTGCDGVLIGVDRADGEDTIDLLSTREASPPITIDVTTAVGDVRAHTWPMQSTCGTWSPMELTAAALVNIQEGGGPSGDAWDYVSGVRGALGSHGVSDPLVDDYHAELVSRLPAD